MFCSTSGAVELGALHKSKRYAIPALCEEELFVFRLSFASILSPFLIAV